MTHELPLDAEFQALLADFHDFSLDSQGGAIYGMWPDFSLAYFNGGWFQFAAENCGEPQISTEWTLGQNMMPAIALPLRQFLHRIFCVVCTMHDLGSMFTIAPRQTGIDCFI